MIPVSIVALALSLVAPGQAPAQRSPGADSLRAELFGIYQRSHTVKLNRDSAGYAAVYSHSFMQRTANVLVQQHITSFRAYMSRVAQLERRTSAGTRPVPERAVASGDRATLTVVVPKECGDAARRQDCRTTVEFVREGGVWKIDRERVEGRP
jgi:hypothetical protein